MPICVDYTLATIAIAIYYITATAKVSGHHSYRYMHIYLCMVFYKWLDSYIDSYIGVDHLT